MLNKMPLYSTKTQHLAESLSFKNYNRFYDLPPILPPKNIRKNGLDEKEEEEPNLARKISVAITGGALVVVGVPLIPLPGPGDVMVVGGLALLATEFPAAQRVLDNGRDKLAEYVQDDSNGTDDADYIHVDTETESKKELGTKMSNDNKETESKKELGTKVSNDDTEIESKKELGAKLSNDIQNGMQRANKSLKHVVRTAILPLMNKVASDRTENGKEECNGTVLEKDSSDKDEKDNQWQKVSASPIHSSSVVQTSLV